nr:hypothetical protein [Leucobacter weissii]
MFEESSQGAVSAVTATVLIISLVLLVGGLLAASYAFDPANDETMNLWLFAGGLIATVLGFAIPFSLLPSSGK